jgi:hypothetical protein
MSKVKVVLLLAAAIVVTSVASAGAAKMLTGKQVVNGSLTGADLKNGSVASRDLSPSVRSALKPKAVGAPMPGPKGDKGDRGERGLTGLMGPQGPRGDVTTVNGTTIVGPKGDPGPQGTFGSIVFRAGSGVSIPAGQEQSIQARCDDPEHAIGGNIEGYGGTVVQQAAHANGADPDTFAATVRGAVDYSAWYYATAICVK